MHNAKISFYLTPIVLVIVIVLLSLAVWSQSGSKENLTTKEIIEVGLGSLPALGDENAKVTLVEFGDFQSKFFLSTKTRIREEYVQKGRVKMYWRDFTFLGPESITLALAARCANKQDAFWQYHDKLFSSEEENPIVIAGQIDLDKETFQSCLESEKYLDDIERDNQEGRELGVQSTPTIFINGEKIVGAQPYELFEEIIEKYLK